MASYKTMQQLITSVETALYQSAGAGVQLYSQDVIQQYVQDAFNHLYEKNWWPRFIVREAIVLNGSTGISVNPVQNISMWRDLRYVFSGTSRVPLPHIPLGLNYASLNGTTAQYIEEAADNHIVRVWPNSATGTLYLVGRSRYNDFALTDLVPFDDTLLKHFAAWSYFTDDGSNPSSAAKHQGLFESRLKVVEDAEFSAPIKLDNYSINIPDQWTESRW